MQTSLLLVFCVVISVVAGCTTDTDCINGCCHMAMCSPYQNISQACHLPNHQVKYMMYPCGCAAGLVCDEIHFDSSLPASVHQAETLLMGHGYGICTDTPGALIGK